ncbi:MAG: D-alanyl-D-alanine carboxypeptidase/D-alanyl-D-alanine-endopeptidase [Chloroherpetonaceae bacterium]|nr:D-alanyl-D-alanine carboxypeptidase/D-alanyl-D-alanine-endopeptidase [Chloroherpetonaceae bacterium]
MLSFFVQVCLRSILPTQISRLFIRRLLGFLFLAGTLINQPLLFSATAQKKSGIKKPIPHKQSNIGLNESVKEVKRISKEALMSMKELKKEFAALFQDSATANFFWGVSITAPNTQKGLRIQDRREKYKVLFELNAEKNFIPASNQKLLSSAAALFLLDSTKRFTTDVRIQGEIKDGVLFGNLVAFSDGNPALSEKFFAGNSQQFFKDVAESLHVKGVQRIAGDLIADDGYFSTEAISYAVGEGDGDYSEGWDWDDVSNGTATAVSALSYNENSIRFFLIRDSVLQKPRLEWMPKTSYGTYQNNAFYVSKGERKTADFFRVIGSNQFISTGAMPLDVDTVQTMVAVERPAFYFLWELKSALNAKGIDVSGILRREPGYAGRENTKLLHQTLSPELLQILAYMNKESSNFTAEQLLRIIGKVRYGEGTKRAGLRAIGEMLDSIGVSKKNFLAFDGSGLTRKNRISPGALRDLLNAIYASRFFDSYRQTLAIGGKDGTLKRRLKKERFTNRVFAKTGFVSGIRTLSGYVLNGEKRWVTFSIMAMNYTQPTAEIEAVQDKAIELILRWNGK